MSNITRLRHALPMSPDINKAIADLDSAIASGRRCQGSRPASGLCRISFARARPGADEHHGGLNARLLRLLVLTVKLF